jgi:tripartite-type tricarboxylate transporter receptor subunit TctC
MMFPTITSAWPLARAGKLRALGVTTLKRSSIAADVPTLAEAGLPGFEADLWQAVFAPAGTSPEIIRRLNAEIVKILLLPDVRERFASLGTEITLDSPDEVAALVRRDFVKWADIVKRTGAKVD